MEAFSTVQKHWEQVYSSKALEESSWYQPRPDTALDFILNSGLPKDAAIIDIGGGDSLLVDHLLDLGYTNLCVLDISAKALEKAQKRLGDRGNAVNWIVADAANFKTTQQYDFWHDRAAFHFLTNDADILHYVQTASTAIKPDGHLMIGTFSKQGPQKCSGLEIRQYSAQSLSEVFASHFQKIKCFTLDHYTPTQAVQNFTFCVFRRKD